jgi:hypothetical protein
LSSDVGPRVTVAKQDLTPYQIELREWAVALQGPTPKVPVPIMEICNELGVTLKRRNSVGRFKSYLSIDPSSSNPASILLPTATMPAAPWENSKFERLCIAHELAHYFLLRKYKLAPRTNSEYWQHEVICDDFARHLLLPDSYLVSKTGSTPPKLSAYLSLCNELEDIAEIPWIHAGVRIGEITNKIAYIKCTARRRDRETIFIFSTTSLPKRRGVRASIKKGLALYDVFAKMFEEAKQCDFPIRYNITGAMRAAERKQHSALRKLAVAEDSISIAEVVGGAQPEIKIVIAYRSVDSVT